jgi:uncharacterized protein
MRSVRLRAAIVTLAVLLAARPAIAQSLPTLSGPVNDFAHVIDADSAREMDRRIRALETTTRDAIVVVTVDSYAPYGSIEEYAVKLFENHGRGIGDKGKDNGLLIVLALKERRVRIETGYAVEQFITDRFAGETIRQYMTPEFRTGGYGQGLLVGTARIVGRIAKARGVTLQDVQLPQDEAPEGRGSNFPLALPVIIFIIILVISRIGGGPGAGLLLWGLSPWSRWSSGVGSFGCGRATRSSRPMLRVRSLGAIRARPAAFARILCPTPLPATAPGETVVRCIASASSPAAAMPLA